MNLEMSGLDFLNLLASGEVGRTPMMATLDYDFTRVEAGVVEFECKLGDYLYNPLGVIHGGLASTMLDSAAACAVQTLLPARTGYTSTDLTVHYLRPITIELGVVRAIGTVLNKGRRTALAQAEVRDAADRLLAHATSSCMIFDSGR